MPDQAVTVAFVTASSVLPGDAFDVDGGTSSSSLLLSQIALLFSIVAVVLVAIQAYKYRQRQLQNSKSSTSGSYRPIRNGIIDKRIDGIVEMSAAFDLTDSIDAEYSDVAQ